MSLSDGMPTMTMPVAPANTGSGGGFGWGGESVWMIVLFLIFAIFGWGGNGWGGNGNNGAADNYVLASDFATSGRLTVLRPPLSARAISPSRAFVTASTP